MKKFRDPSPGDVAPVCETGVVTAIGFFDGAHLGHQQVFNQVKELAKTSDCCSAVVTFDPHPAQILRPENAPGLLTSHEHKLELFEEAGFDISVTYSFDRELAELSPRDFVQRLLVEGLQVKTIVVGEDFHFGAGRVGDVDTLRELGEEFGFTVAPVVLLSQEQSESLLVSSTAIRRALAGGDIEKVNDMLGRPHEIRGVVIHGDKRGRTIGFPTANVQMYDMVVPADGVYTGSVKLADGTEYRSAVNIGKRPTFHQNQSESLLEAHLLDFDEDIYDQEITVRLLKYLRSERRFAGADKLAAQLQRDIETVRSS